MYKYGKPTKTSIKRNTSYEGERIEQKIQRIMNNKEPITDGAPLIFTERKDGVKPAYNIRTDTMEIACEAMDKVQKDKIAKREARGKTVGEQAKEGMAKESGAQSTQGTNSGSEPTK